MLADGVEVLLRFTWVLEHRHRLARPARLNVILQRDLLPGPQLDAEARALQLGGCAIGGDELVEAVAPAPAPFLGAEIAQHRRHHRQRHEALLPVHDLEKARLAVARLGQIAAGAVKQEDSAQEVVGLRRLGACQARRPEDILEELPRFLCGPRERPLITGDRIVEGKREQIGDSQGRCWQSREHRTSFSYCLRCVRVRPGPEPRVKLS